MIGIGLNFFIGEEYYWGCFIMLLGVVFFVLLSVKCWFEG